MGKTWNVGFANGSKGMRHPFGGCALGAVGGTLAIGIGHDVLSVAGPGPPWMLRSTRKSQSF